MLYLDLTDFEVLMKSGQQKNILQEIRELYHISLLKELNFNSLK